MTAPIFVCSAKPGDMQSDQLVEALRRLTNPVYAVSWIPAEFSIQARLGQSSQVLECIAGPSRPWLVISDVTLLPQVADFCTAERLHVAFLVNDELDDGQIELLGLADLVIIPAERTLEDAERRLESAQSTVGFRRPCFASMASTNAVDDLVAAIKEWVPLRRVWCYVEGTIRTQYNSGIQRLARGLCKGLQLSGVNAIPIGWNSDCGSFRSLGAGELAHLARWNGPVARAGPQPEPTRDDWLIIPEIVLPPGPAASDLIGAAKRLGLRVAYIFFDLIPLKLSPLWPGRAPPIYDTSVARLYERFWSDLAQADAILPISQSAGDDLLEWIHRTVWKQTNLYRRLVPIKLAGEFPERPRNTSVQKRKSSAEFTFLSVGTVEPRKNHLRLIEAFQLAAKRPNAPPMRLIIAGSQSPHPDYAGAVRQAAQVAAGEGAIIEMIEGAGDSSLAELYDRADAVVYASYEEGFGLPILEASWFGRPCLCHNDGAILETAQAGGALTVDMLDVPAVAAAMLELASNAELVSQLGLQACQRPIKTWTEYAREVACTLGALARPGHDVVRHLMASNLMPVAQYDEPLLSICITTYNRSAWLAVTLARVLQLTRSYRDVVEVVVCDNASTDSTPDVVKRCATRDEVRYHRNTENVGMLGNLPITASLARGRFVWLLGDDDVLVEGVIEDVLEGILDYPDIEMIYLNYATTHFAEPEKLLELDDFVRSSTACAAGGTTRRVDRLRYVSTVTENIFTAIYACIFRRDHAVRAFSMARGGAPFTSLRTAAPSAEYVMKVMLDRPAYWIAQPGLVVNLNVSWSESEALWRLECLPELYDWLEWEREGGPRVDYYRWLQVSDAPRIIHGLYSGVVRGGSQINLRRFVARSMHLSAFRCSVLPKIRQVLREEARKQGSTNTQDGPASALRELALFRSGRP